MASQCLQTAFCLSSEDDHLKVDQGLLEIFENATKEQPVKMKTGQHWKLLTNLFLQLKKKATPPPEVREKADGLKLEGNQLMKDENYEEAAKKYTA